MLTPFTSALGDQIIAANSGLAGTDVVVDFGANVFANLTNISNEFPPLVIGHARYFTTVVSNNLVGGFITNDFSGAPNTLTIDFDQPVRDVSFVYHQISTSGPSTFRAMLGGVVVDSFSNTSNQSQPNNYFGFANLVFDRVELDFVNDFNVDEIAFNYAGPTGAAYCFGDGTGVLCPCATFSGPGEGCPTTSGTGATLSGAGSAMVGNDSLVLSVSGGPANKPGLFFQANNQLANPAGDGILCAAGSTIRYAVNPLDAAGATSQGGFGLNAAPGLTRNYQYWFRDTGNPCGGGFNFSNGWSQPWQ